ncbi:MAG: glycoside hydrolase family 3 C-terminal domain-containing protein [Clostridia bacterium]|nr:glycoside hydrolase family 3 C-terminal domain-containing protein [Clostridia bacterium]
MANKKKKKGGFSIGKAFISLLLAVGLVAGNYACWLNEGLITMYLCGDGAQDQSEEAIAARESGKALAQKVEEEGAVLLKNETLKDGTKSLPLKENTKVNVFGFSGSDRGFIPQGTGSGTGSRNELVTFLGGLKEAGIEYNETLAAAYNNLGWSRAGGGSYIIEAHGDRYKDFYGVSEAPESFYTDNLMQNAVAYSDTAIVVLGRLMGEGNDFSKVQYFSNQAGGGQDTSRKLQSLSAREEYMIDLVAENFENVILVTNTGNPLELGIADTDKVDAVLNMGMPGTRGTIGLANILSGKANPSGKLADTWAYDLSTAASYATSGLEGVGYYYINGEQYSAYTEYRENIYNGYLWYETADKEGFWDSDFSKNRWNIKNGYEDVVQYPFGYGLSYTNFDWELKETSFKDGAKVAKEDTLKVTVRVTNTGNVAGKDVVELYYSAPYTKGGIEKSAIKLGGFAKTPEIEPGQYADVIIEMPIEEMKSYDCYDKNNNGFMGYELEKGNYEISFRSDVHTLKKGMDDNQMTLVVEEDIRYEVDSKTGTKVENVFTNYTNPVSGATSKVNEPFHPNPVSYDGSEHDDGATEYMTRNDFVGTFPKEKVESRNMGSLYTKMSGIYTPIDEEGLEIPEYGSKKTNWKIQDLAGVPYDDAKWDEIVSQLTYDRAIKMITDAGYGTTEIAEIGMPGRNETDGPSGFNINVTGGNKLAAVNYPCPTVLAQTWDWYMAYQVGVAVGMEGTSYGYDGWYGPGGNVHRSAMGGRNFEYYSEDGLVSGTMLAYHVLGAKEQGVLAYIKHIGANEDDKERTMGQDGCYKWFTEQTFRENYLKSFEVAIKRGGVNALMVSATRTGGMRSTGSYAMISAVVRNEWGFRGTIITDYYQGRNINDFDECIRAGCNQMLEPNGNVSFDTKNIETSKYYVHQAAKDFIYAYVETKHYAATAQGLENSAMVGVSVAKDIFPWWIPLLTLVNTVLLTSIIVLNVGGSSESKSKSKKIR